GLSREANVLAAKYTHSAFKMSLADAQRLLVQATDGAYFQAQLGRERLRITRADVEFSSQQLEAVRKRRTAGKATEADVLNFQVRLLAARTDEQAALGLYDNARIALAELMGMDDARLPDDVKLSPLEAESEDELTAPDADEWVQKAWAARPDLAQAEFELKSKTEQVKSIKGQFSPSILLNGSYGFDRLSNLEYSVDDQASAGAIELRWNLFTGGFRTSRLRQTQAQRWELLANLRRRRQKVASEVRQSVTTLVNSQEQVRLQDMNLVAAQENRRIVEKEFAAGKASLVRLNEAQRDLIGTDAGLALARIRLRQAWTDLRAAAAVHQWEAGPPGRQDWWPR
ncbi:MAG: TolC family protein, partial [Phycisphaerae bacterium]